MKKILCTLFAVVMVVTMLPLQSLAAGFTYEPPTEAFLKSALKKSKSEVVYLEMNKKGKWSVADMDAMYALEWASTIEAMLSEDSYNDMKDILEENDIKSYDEYKEYMIDQIKEMGYDYPPKQSEAKLYFSIDFYGENDFGYSSEEIFLRGAEYVLSMPKNNPSLMKKITSSMQSGKGYYFGFYFEVAGRDLLNIRGGCVSVDDYIKSLTAGDYSKITEFDETISLSGKKGIVLGDTLVPADTKKLCISSRTSGIVDMLWGSDLPEDCVVAGAVPEYGSTISAKEETVYDLAEIAKALPNLKELYIFQGVLKDPKKITNFKKLETLYYYPVAGEGKSADSVKTTPFKNMKSLKKLGLFIDYSSYDFLSEMTWLKEAFVETSGKNTKKLKKIFSCNYITGMTINDPTDLSGIEKLTNLKELELGNGDVKDFTPVSKLKNLETLYIRAIHDANGISSITNLKKLKTLTLHSMDEEDMSFVGNITGLEDLSLCYVNSSFTKSIGKLTKLKSLTLMDIGANGGGYGWGGSYDASFLPKLTNLESLNFCGNDIDITGISKLKRLKSVSISLCRFRDLSELKKCPALTHLLVYNNQSSFDIQWLSGSKLEDLRISDGSDGGIKNMDKIAALKNLKTVMLDFTGISESAVKKIKKALPKCEIRVYELGYGDDKVY